jgi:hypothetical protein
MVQEGDWRCGEQSEQGPDWVANRNNGTRSQRSDDADGSTAGFVVVRVASGGWQTPRSSRLRWPAGREWSGVSCWLRRRNDHNNGTHWQGRNDGLQRLHDGRRRRSGELDGGLGDSPMKTGGFMAWALLRRGLYGERHEMSGQNRAFKLTRARDRRCRPRQPIRAWHVVTRSLPIRSHSSTVFPFFKNPRK